MIDPKVIFENDILKFKSKLPFTYKWIIRSDNRENRLNIFNKYKDKLGWYVEFHNKENNNIDSYARLYKPYEKLSNILTKLNDLEYKKKKSLENKFQIDNTHFILKKGNYIYKGTKYFYKPEEEYKFFDELPYGYYGDKYLAYFYARRYSGGLQVYKTNKDLKLFNVTNDKNMFYILNLIKKSDDIFFNNITYNEFYKAIKVKYGVGINKYFQAYNISKYTRFNEIWLYEPEKTLNYTVDKKYTGWYYGAGQIDRICATGIMHLIKDKFDGITSETGYYTPFSSYTGTEIIIWNQKEVLERKPNHKYDSMQFIKKLHFDPFSINFDISLAIKNQNFNMINFYLNHKIDLNHYIQTDGLKIMSLNIHNFVSINLDDKSEFILKTLLELCKHYDIDLCFLQEYYTDMIIESKYYNYIIDKSHIGLVVLYKKNLDIKNIKSFKLPNEKYLDQRRFCLMFELNSEIFATTHLEIGKRFYDRSGSLLLADEFYEVIQFNYNVRKKQLDKILEYNPNYIIGDFNFNRLDKEYEYIISKGYNTGLVDYTTPFNKQVDFIFSKKKYKLFTKINFQYSDHLPVIGIY